MNLSRIKSLERKAHAMSALGDAFDFWSDEELERVAGIDSIESWSDEKLKDVIDGTVLGKSDYGSLL